MVLGRLTHMSVISSPSIGWGNFWKWVAFPSEWISGTRKLASSFQKILGKCLNTKAISWLWATFSLNSMCYFNRLLLPMPSSVANPGYNSSSKSLTFAAAWSLARCWFHHPSCLLGFEGSGESYAYTNRWVMAREHFRWQYPVCVHCKTDYIRKWLDTPRSGTLYPHVDTPVEQ